MLSLLAFIFGKDFLDPRLRYMLLIFGVGMLIWRVRKALKKQEQDQLQLQREIPVEPEQFPAREPISYEEALKLCRVVVKESGKTYRMDPCPAQIKQAMDSVGNRVKEV